MKGFLLGGVLCVLSCSSCSRPSDDLTYSMGGNSWYSDKDGFSTGITYHSDETSRIRVVLIHNLTQRPLPGVRSTLTKQADGTFVYKINATEITVDGDLTLIALGDDVVPRKIPVARSSASSFLSKLRAGAYTRDDIVAFWSEFIEANSA